MCSSIAIVISILSTAVVIVEFKDSNYSVLESDRIFNVTLVKQGNPSRPIRVSITLSDITTSGKCVTM